MKRRQDRQQLRDKDAISNNTVIQPAELLAALQKTITQNYGLLGLSWTGHANKIICYNYLAGPCILLKFKQTDPNCLILPCFIWIERHRKNEPSEKNNRSVNEKDPTKPPKKLRGIFCPLSE